MNPDLDLGAVQEREAEREKVESRDIVKRQTRGKMTGTGRDGRDRV